jgi:Asp-tRNA(Asn)/Glu-tRNA(Gln) amidotransferase A subunit family amidase
MMGPIAGLEAEPVGVEEVRVAVARSWLDECDPLVRARVDAAAGLFPNREDVAFPIEAGEYDVFAYEVARVHETLFAEHRDEYGEEVARKIERCSGVTEGEAQEAAERREAYRVRCAEILDGFDLLLTPTQPFVAPRIEDAMDDALRERIIRFTYPFDSLGWPALALPCGPAEEGLPASVQLAAPQGSDALVLGVGMALEHALSVST